MLLLPVLLATALWSRGDAQAVPVQTPELQRPVKGSSASMACRMTAEAVVHWYRQLPGEPPKRILYMSGQSPVFDDSSDRGRFQVRKKPTEPVYALTIDFLTPRDSGTYYCAYCEYYKVFGTGTKLIVSDKQYTAPASSEILQKQHGNLITYVCLIEKFYPDVIRVTWTDGESKEVTDNVVKGDTWKPANEDKYSISSWLTVPVENKDKNYNCKYEHENQLRSLPTQDSTKTAAPQEEDCSTNRGNSTVFNRDHLMHRTAYLVYIVLLLKSTMYYLIVLFFIYRMWAPTKHQGKTA
ncbi:T-cell receptor gamma alternate reading frame protein isoform 4-T4 [Theristicus caerulescens]